MSGKKISVAIANNTGALEFSTNGDPDPHPQLGNTNSPMSMRTEDVTTRLNSSGQIEHILPTNHAGLITQMQFAADYDMVSGNETYGALNWTLGRNDLGLGISSFSVDRGRFTETGSVLTPNPSSSFDSGGLYKLTLSVQMNFHDPFFRYDFPPDYHYDWRDAHAANPSGGFDSGNRMITYHSPRGGGVASFSMFSDSNFRYTVQTRRTYLGINDTDVWTEESSTALILWGGQSAINTEANSHAQNPSEENRFFWFGPTCYPATILASGTSASLEWIAPLPYAYTNPHFTKPPWAV